MKLTALILTVALSIGCAGKASKVYTAADSATIDAVLAFKNAKDIKCDAGEVPASSCEAIAKAFVPVFEASLEVTRLALAEAPLPEVDAAIGRFKAAGIKFKDAIRNVEGNAKQLLLDLLESALRRFDRA